MKRRLFYILAISIGLLITAALVTASIWPVVNEVETGKSREYPEIQPQFYSTDPARVFDEAKASVGTLEHWTLVEANERTRVIEAERTAPVLGFTDDVIIRVEPATEFVTQVNLHSKSRFGKGDFGQNARNIRTFFGELDRRLGAVRFDPQRAKKEDSASEPDAESKI